MDSAVKHKIIYISDQEAWARYIHHAFEYDFYHTWYYQNLEKDGIPLLYVYEEADVYIAFPLVKRSIPDSPLYDLTSVYGYTGPVSNQRMDTLPPDFLERFKQSFLNFLQSGRQVSVFSRLHPYFQQAAVMDLFPGVHPNGKVVAIDLAQSLEEQRMEYHKSFRQQIRSLRNKGYVVAETNKPDDIRAFAEIYTENMKRIGASDYYLFTEAYFIELLSSDEFVSSLVLVYYDGVPVCGAVAISTTTIMQVHLLGTRTVHLPASPSKLLVDELTVIARHMGLKYINLGGGVGFKMDSLFNWKAGFSSLHLDYSSWRYVVNEPIYNKLLEENHVEYNPDIDFFPLYRYNPVVKS